MDYSMQISKHNTYLKSHIPINKILFIDNLLLSSKLLFNNNSNQLFSY